MDQNANMTQNLANTFVEKAINHIVYDIYAKRAALEGYEYIKDIYHELSENERHNARTFYDRLSEEAEGGELPRSGEYAVTVTQNDTLGNLAASIKRCESCCSGALPQYYQTAQQEGFADVAALYKVTLDNEQNNLRFFEALYNQLQTNKIYKSEHAAEWKCSKCGEVHRVNGD